MMCLASPPACQLCDHLFGVQVLTQSFVTSVNVRGMATSASQRGISSKQILLATATEQVCKSQIRGCVNTRWCMRLNWLQHAGVPHG